MTAPRFAALEAALASRPAFRASAGEGAGRAAVALLLRPTWAEPELLLIRRAEREGDPWSGHMALPGGRAAPSDPDPVATAARESAEEVGIDPARAGRLLGALDEVAPRSTRGPAGLVVSPFRRRSGSPSPSCCAPRRSPSTCTSWPRGPRCASPRSTRAATWCGG